MRFLALELIILAATTGCGNVVVGTGAASSTGASSSTGSPTGTGGAPSTTSTSSTGDDGGTGLAPGQCRSMSDCAPVHEACVPPTGWMGCGGPACPPLTPCTGDADCAAQGATFICVVFPCCNGVQACTQGCTSDAVCAMGETCASNHRCVPTACTSAGDCPVDFDCESSACQRRACASDAACSGYCVLGSCYQTPGTCSLPPV